MMEKRIGTIIILLHDTAQAGVVNQILSEFCNSIIGRQGLPSRVHNKSIISVILEATTDEFGALSGKLGRIKDISVKSAVFPSSVAEFKIV
ncbi:MAG: CopG family transcriptional regulator [Marinilabiliales bacterium]|nr:MAG: CopG family transcriptional regulator [Marinilabiliales bacterium]